MLERPYHPPDATREQEAGRSPELDLLLLCARWPQRAEDRQLICEKLAGRLDWQRFLLLAQHHRLVPLVSHSLHACATGSQSLELDAVLAQLQQLAVSSALHSLRSLAELRRSVEKLHASGISVRVLKGLPLAQATFGDLSLRSTGDIDLLIDQSSILQADEVLRGFGYRSIFQIDRFSPKRLAFYRSHWKDLAYSNSATGFEVDLHWRCFRNSQMPGSGLCATPATESVSFGGFRVDTLPRMEGLLYLCVHGTLDGWLYFKSLADIAAQVRAMSEAELGALAVLAASYGVLPELSAALILARRYLSVDHWSAQLLLANDPTVAHILRYVDQTLVQGNFLAEREAIPIATTMGFEFGLRRNFRYRYELLLRILFRVRMWETMPLPDFLFGLYPLLSPFEWLIFRLRRPKPDPTLTI